MNQLGQNFLCRPKFSLTAYSGAFIRVYNPGAGCSKLTTSLVNVSLNLQKLISQICQYFLLKRCVKLLHLLFFQQKISVYLVIKS